MSIGFTVICGDQDVAFRLHPEAAKLLSFGERDDAKAVILGRLHYRREPLDELRARASADELRSSASSDAALALAVYRHLGLKGLQRLEGELALVIWDGREKCLIGMRDPLGGYPLFWTRTGSNLAVSTSLRELKEMQPCRLDLEYLADYLMLPRWSLAESDDGRCAWQGIQRVLAGTTIESHMPFTNVSAQRYWDWLDRIVDPRTDRLEEMTGRYADLLHQAVRERLHGHTAAHMSGGMDSTAVCLIAAEFARQGQTEAPVHGLTLVYDRLSGLARQKAYLDEIAARPGLVSQRVLADDLLDFDSFADAPNHDEPCPWLWRTTMERALMDEAAKAGATTILTGVGADEIVDQAPFHLTSLLRRGRLWAAWSEAARWGHADNCSPWRYLYPFGVVNLLPAWFRAGGTFRGGFAAWETLNEWTIAPWVKPDFARRYELRRRGLDNLRRLYHRCADVGLSQALYGIADHVNDYSRWHLAAPRGMALSHPFLDPRLLRYGLGLQTRYRPDPNYRKAILAEAMRGVLPDAIRTRKSKGAFNEIYYLGLTRNLPALEALIHDAPTESLGLFDKGVLLTCLHKAALGSASGISGIIRLNVTLTFLKWLTLNA